MITIQNSSKDPTYNLAFEDYVFTHVREGTIFLLWQNDPAIVCGRYQNIFQEVDVPAVLESGITIARRISGGGTVYHDAGNLNYSLIMDQEENLDYGAFVAPVIDALQKMGIPAERDRVCDIALNGRKISGSAQRAEKGRILHHGTLLYASDLQALDAITTGNKNQKMVSKSTASAICTVTNIQDECPNECRSIEAFKEELLHTVLPEGSQYLTLTQAQKQEIEALRDEQYRTWAWTYGKNPPFSLEREGIVGGEPVEIIYHARKGVIDSLSVESPLEAVCAIEKGLCGARLDPSPDGLPGRCRQLLGEMQGMELYHLLLRPEQKSNRS